MAVAAGIQEFRGSPRGGTVPGRGIPQRRRAVPPPLAVAADSESISSGGGGPSPIDYAPTPGTIPLPAPVAREPQLQSPSTQAALEGLQSAVEPSAGFAQEEGVGGLNPLLGQRLPPTLNSMALSGLRRIY